MRSRNLSINIRISEEEKVKLERNASRCSLSLSAYMRKCSLGKQLGSFPQKEFYEIYKAICMLNNDLELYSREETQQYLSSVAASILSIYIKESQGESDSCN